MMFKRSFFSWNWLKGVMPKGLYARAILIIIVPTFLTLVGATFVFFDRHWTTTSTRLAQAVVGDIRGIKMLADAQDLPDHAALLAAFSTQTGIQVVFEKGKKIEDYAKLSLDPLVSILSRELSLHIPPAHRIHAQRKPPMLLVILPADEGVYVFYVPMRRIYTPTTKVFISWMIGSSLLLSVIALLFMRNQMRPVRRLAQAAEAIGKGQDVPLFKLEGATEVRQAGRALLVMRDRIRRSMNQRTTMLAGVSHDLRTPLTRMKLQLAMMPESSATRGFTSDIAEMEAMLEAYLAFARGEEEEASVEVDMAQLLQEVVQNIARGEQPVTLNIENTARLFVRPSAIKRCIGNLIHNALRYGKKAEVSLLVRDHVINILVDDEGAGIPVDRREDVFRPFYRLDESRNMETGGVGLGLSIARDIAHAHGGNLVLEDAPEGGLRARLWLPV
ncbi:MAG: ATP-binding protein [Alphaproteobacteria bacterium]|nr:ATP-binding protein [Alphaproteobacteria bacterium]